MIRSSSTRRGVARLGVVMVAMLALGGLGMGIAHAVPPFVISINEPVTVNNLTVTLSGTADSPSSATHHIVVEWGDTNTDDIPLAATGPWTWGTIDHTYAAGGTYTITTTIIHSQDSGNDTGNSATDSTVVEIPTCTENCEVDPCVENPQAEGCATPTPTPTPTPTTTPPPAAENPPEVLGKTVTKKPLAKTASAETTALAWAGVLMLMVGATFRLCTVAPAAPIKLDDGAEDLVAKSLDLVARLVRPRDGTRG
jgi:hypothetical protein